MKELMASPYFGVGLSVVAFWIGEKLHSKLKTPICNPLIVAIVLIVGVLLIFDIPYDSYDVGGALINMFLAPATACLAVAIYTKIDVLKKYWLPIVVGCTAGSAASMASVFGMCKLFGLDQSMTVSLIPKSVTTPIAVSISEPGRWCSADYGGCCYFHGDSWKYSGSDADQNIPCEGFCGSRTCDRCM